MIAVFLTVIVVVVFLMPAGFRKWTAVGTALIFLIPWFLWNIYNPPVIDLTAHTSTIDYEFRDLDYAQEFASLNQHADWLDISLDPKVLGRLGKNKEPH